MNLARKYFVIFTIVLVITGCKPVFDEQSNLNITYLDELKVEEIKVERFEPMLNISESNAFYDGLGEVKKDDFYTFLDVKDTLLLYSINHEIIENPMAQYSKYKTYEIRTYDLKTQEHKVLYKVPDDTYIEYATLYKDGCIFEVINEVEDHYEYQIQAVSQNQVKSLYIGYANLDDYETFDTIRLADDEYIFVFPYYNKQKNGKMEFVKHKYYQFDGENFHEIPYSFPKEYQFVSGFERYGNYFLSYWKDEKDKSNKIVICDKSEIKHVIGIPDNCRIYRTSLLGENKLLISFVRAFKNKNSEYTIDYIIVWDFDKKKILQAPLTAHYSFEERHQTDCVIGYSAGIDTFLKFEENSIKYADISKQLFSIDQNTRHSNGCIAIDKNHFIFFSDSLKKTYDVIVTGEKGK